MFYDKDLRPDLKRAIERVASEVDAGFTSHAQSMSELVNSIDTATDASLSVVTSLNSIADSLKEICRFLKLAVGPPTPGVISVRSLRQEIDGMIVFTISLPLPWPDKDVVSGEVTVTVANNAPVTVPVSLGAEESPEFKGEAGETVSATFAYVDAAGNRSAHPAAVENVVLQDTFPPVDPAAIGIVAKRQE